MDLGTWLTQSGTPKYALAKRAGVSWRLIHRIVAKRHRPRVETAEKIARATNGCVTAAEILGLPSTHEAA